MKGIPVTILDYGMGNLGSVARAIAHVGGQVTISDEAEVLRRAPRLIIPGQGAIPPAMASLRQRNLTGLITELIGSKPTLGLCLGLQMMFGPCEEGPSTALGVWPGAVKRFSATARSDNSATVRSDNSATARSDNSATARSDNSATARSDNSATARSGERLKVPQIGWNEVRHVREHPLWQGIADGQMFYFVHSYYAAPDHEALVFGRTEYGVDFASACGRDCVFAVQFHPEKSGLGGLQLLKNFLHWIP